MNQSGVERPEIGKLDRTDRLILHELQQDGSLTNVELAARVYVSSTACSRRRRRLEEAGFILGCYARVDSVRLGYAETVFVEVKLRADGHDNIVAFEEAVQRVEEVMECHAVAGHLDYLLRVVAHDTQHYERVHDVLGRLPGVDRVDSSFALRTAVRRTALPMGQA